VKDDFDKSVDVFVFPVMNTCLVRSSIAVETSIRPSQDPVSALQNCFNINARFIELRSQQNLFCFVLTPLLLTSPLTSLTTSPLFRLVTGFVASLVTCPLSWLVNSPVIVSTTTLIQCSNSF
jgi:hypothetical protein